VKSERIGTSPGSLLGDSLKEFRRGSSKGISKLPTPPYRQRKSNFSRPQQTPPIFYDASFVFFFLRFFTHLFVSSPATRTFRSHAIAEQLLKPRRTIMSTPLATLTFQLVKLAWQPFYIFFPSVVTHQVCFYPLGARLLFPASCNLGDR